MKGVLRTMTADLLMNLGEEIFPIVETIYGAFAFSRFYDLALKGRVRFL